MTLQECYAVLGGSCDEVLGRLRSESLVQKFVIKFLSDPSYELLCASMEAENYGEAFRAAHTLKGVCQNLAFTDLYASSAQLCEALRDGFHPEAPALKVQVDADYRQTADAIRVYQAGLGL